jgi:hypothetical protein
MLFGLLSEMQTSRLKVVRSDVPSGSLAPATVDRFWEEVHRAPLVPGARNEPPLPAIVRNVSSAIRRLLIEQRRVTTFAMVSFGGEVDLDLFGILLANNYRICSEETVIVNRVLDTTSGPGSGAFWLLTRYLGFAAANHLLVEGKSLTAQEALELRLVNRVVNAADLEAESQSTAERFAAKPASALASFVRASNYLEADLATYLERVGSGFGG